MHRPTQLLQDLNRPRWLLLVTVIGLLVGLLLTLPAWAAVRLYPLAPIIPNFSLPPTLHTILLLVGIVGLGSSLIWPRRVGSYLSVALASLLLLILLDYTRLQPWILHYSLILILFTLPLRRHLSDTRLLDAARVVVGGIYFWSGIQKLNTRFFVEIFPTFSRSLWEIAPEHLFGVFFIIGILVPFIEIAFALGFFSRRWRRLAILGSTAMLVFVLIALGPLGNNWNSSVWPWNIAIYSMVLVLFLNTDFTLREFLQRLRTNHVALALVGIVWIMPAGNIFSITDHYLSWSLYSGHATEATISGDPLLLEALSPAASSSELTVIAWSTDTLNVVPYPETRVFRQIFYTLCRQYPTHDLTLTVTEFGFWNSLHTHKTVDRCT